MSETSEPPMGEPTLLARREGAAGTLLMNRPKTLNALDLAMIRDFQAAIDAWKDDASVKLVVLEGAGGKAFCAGGDVRRIRQLAIDGDAAAIEAFFAEEYAVNRGIATFGKPWVSLIDGFCMGGGIGLSVHGAPIVVSEIRDAGDAGDGDRAVPRCRHLLHPAAAARRHRHLAGADRHAAARRRCGACRPRHALRPEGEAAGAA